VQRLSETHAERTAIDRTASVARVDILRALRMQIHAYFEIRDKLSAGILSNFGSIADMIVMAVGEHNVGRPVGRLFGAARKFRVAGQERIDENDGSGQLNAESGMTKPDELHAGPRKDLKEQGKMRDIAGSYQYTKCG
jgi:hypothetical protein